MTVGRYCPQYWDCGLGLAAMIRRRGNKAAKINGQ